jgi:hypothetical protein
MAQEHSVATARAAGATQTNGDSSTTKGELQRQMDETRDSISQTVTEIKDKVADQYQSVKDSVSDSLDWREQFRRHPAAWSLGALSVGYVIGSSIAASLKDGADDDQLLSQLATVADHFTDELSKRGMNILMPALTGTILVPMLTSKLNEMFGIDLSNLSDQLLAQSDTTNKATSGKGRKKKKNGVKKNGKRKGGKRKADLS